jgi:ketosteroid isomerase-like protein
MRPAENKALIKKMGEAGTLEDALRLLADDVRWTVIGKTKFSGTYAGKQDLVNRLIVPLTSQLETMGTSMVDQVIADDDCVVVQSRVQGRRTKSGRDYNNTYCIVYRLVGGLVQEVTEYCDTELVTAAFGA